MAHGCRKTIFSGMANQWSERRVVCMWPRERRDVDFYLLFSLYFGALVQQLNFALTNFPSNTGPEKLLGSFVGMSAWVLARWWVSLQGSGSPQVAQVTLGVLEAISGGPWSQSDFDGITKSLLSFFTLILSRVCARVLQRLHDLRGHKSRNEGRQGSKSVKQCHFSH